MYLLYRFYGPHTTKCVVYAAIVTALHAIIDLKHRSPQFRLYPLIMHDTDKYIMYVKSVMSVHKEKYNVM